MDLLERSFDPIMDATSQADLLPKIIQAQVGLAARAGRGRGTRSAPAERSSRCQMAAPHL